MATTVYRFGDLCLDPASRKLWRGDEEVPLPPKVFNCVVYLVENRDRAVEHDELITAVWGEDHYLSDKALVQSISLARRALGDNGGDREYIETVRGFGYRWAVPVEAVEATLENGATPSIPAPLSAAEPRSRDKPIALWTLLAFLAVGIMVTGTLYLQRGRRPSAPEGPPPPRTEGEIALLLPVAVDAEGDSDHTWVRLGAMDLIAARLSEAGQAMVPSDTVIALLRGRPQEPGPADLDHLTDTTGARLVLAADAQATGARWTVSLRSVYGSKPPLTVVGEASDVLAAARTAADRMAAALGMTPAVEAETEPGLERLQQRTNAALLAQQIDAARSLIGKASPRLRQHPEIQFQMGRIAYYGGDLDTAKVAFESLIREIPAQRDPLVRARALNGLGATHNDLDEPGAAVPPLNEALSLLQELGAAADFAADVRLNLGIATDKLGDVDAARTHYAHARRIFESLGDARGLASLDLNMGALEGRRERYDKARRYFASAERRSAATRSIRSELIALVNRIEADLGLLDPQSAIASEPRLLELLERTEHEGLIASANLTRAGLLEVTGRNRAARELLDQVMRNSAADDSQRPLAVLVRAEHAMKIERDPAHAADLAAEAVAELARYPFDYIMRARAWLTQVQALLALGDHAAATEAANALTTWAEQHDTPAPRLHAALAAAELAAAENRHEEARTAFERALALAEAGHVPLHVLRVAESYVPWLLGRGPADADRALVVAGLVGEYTDRHYGAALLRLQVYHALGPVSAWREALARAQSLAGERQVPQELLVPPGFSNNVASA